MSDHPNGYVSLPALIVRDAAEAVIAAWEKKRDDAKEKQIEHEMKCFYLFPWSRPKTKEQAESRIMGREFGFPTWDAGWRKADEAINISNLATAALNSDVKNVFLSDYAVYILKQHLPVKAKENV